MASREESSASTAILSHFILVTLPLAVGLLT